MPSLLVTNYILFIGVKGGPGRWPLQNMAKAAASAGIACRCYASQRATKVKDVLIQFLGNAVSGDRVVRARLLGWRASTMDLLRIHG
jgi:hypothetical protein